MPAAPPDAVAALLDEATASARDPARAIEPVLAAWRLVPAPALAAIIDELAPWQPARAESLRRRKVWRLAGAEGRLGDVPALLRVFDLHWLPAELIAMTRWPRDPRVSLGVARQLPRAPLADRAAIVAHLIELGDPQTVAPVEAALGADDAAVVALRARAAAATLSPAAAAALARFRVVRAGHVAEDRALLDEVLAEPAADAPRLVYGDWLQGHGDPRGELIALQFRRHRGRFSQQERRRERELITAHGQRWLGGLAACCTARGFERGFVSEVQLQRFVIAPRDCPDWATVRTLDLHGTSGAGAIALITAPVMRSLRAVEGTDGSLMVELGRLPTPVGLERLAGHASYYGLSDDPAALVRAPGLAGLRTLELNGWAPWLPSSELLGGLHRLEVSQYGDGRGTGSWVASVLAGGHALEHVVIRHTGLELRLGPGPGRLARLELTRTFGDGPELRQRLETLLAGLPVGSITVCAVGDSLAELIGDRVPALLRARQPGAVIEPLAEAR